MGTVALATGSACWDRARPVGTRLGSAGPLGSGCRFAIDLDHNFGVWKSKKDHTETSVCMKNTIKRVEQFFFPSLPTCVTWHPGQQVPVID